MKAHVLPGLAVYWYMEVRVFEVYGGHPLPCLEGGLWGLHFKRLCFQVIVQCAQIQDRSPPAVGFGYQTVDFEPILQYFCLTADAMPPTGSCSCEDLHSSLLLWEFLSD